MKQSLEILKNFWFVITFIAFLILWYANVNNRLNNAEAFIREQREINNQINTIQTNIAAINTNIEFIKRLLNQ